MTLLRLYNEEIGMDLSWLYDLNNIFDQKKKQAQEDWLDNHTEQEIIDLIDEKIDKIKISYSGEAADGIIQAGKGGRQLFEQLKNNPDIGYPLYGRLINTVFRGARLGKFYLRSAATHVGKYRLRTAYYVCYDGTRI